MRTISFATFGAAVLTAACAGASPTGAAARPAPTPITAMNWDSMGVLTRGIPCDTPVVMRSSSDRRATSDEYGFLRRHYPGYQRGTQALAMVGGRPMDILEITMPDGTHYSVCFDISNSYGHF